MSVIAGLIRLSGAPDEGAQDALAYLGLHLGDGGSVQIGCGMVGGTLCGIFCANEFAPTRIGCVF